VVVDEKGIVRGVRLHGMELEKVVGELRKRR
jgi:hypothetical protein